MLELELKLILVSHVPSEPEEYSLHIFSYKKTAKPDAFWRLLSQHTFANVGQRKWKENKINAPLKRSKGAPLPESQ